MSNYAENKLRKLKECEIIKDIESSTDIDKFLLIKRITSEKEEEINSIKNSSSSYMASKDNKKYYSEDAIKRVRYLKSEIKSLNEYLKYMLINDSNDKDENYANCSDNILLSEDEEVILNKILNNEQSIESLQLSILTKITKYMIHNYDVKNIKDFLYSVIVLLNNKLYSDDNVDFLLLDIKNTLKIKSNELDKDIYSYERKILNKYKRLISLYIDVYKKSKEYSYDNIYDVVSIWLDDVDSYDYLIDLFNKIPRTINLRDKNNNHILIDILNRYVEASKEFLNNSKESSKEKNFYLNLYKFLRYKSYLSCNDEFLLNNILDEFKDFLKKSSYNRQRVNACLLECLNIDVLNDTLLTSEDDSLSEYYLLDDIISVESRMKRVNIEEEVIMLNDNFYNSAAYSLFYDNGEYTLKVHVVDVASIIYEGTNTYKYYKEHKLKKDSKYVLPKKILKRLSFGLFKNMPSITYEVKIKNNKINSFNMYKSRVCVSKIVKPSFKEDIELYSDLCNEVFGTVFDESLLEEIVQSSLVNYVKEKNIDAIYQLKSRKSDNDISRNISKINYKLSKLSLEDANTIYSIVLNNNSSISYSNLYDEEMECTIPFINPLDNFICYTNQKVLFDNNYFFKKSEVVEESINVKKLTK